MKPRSTAVFAQFSPEWLYNLKSRGKLSGSIVLLLISLLAAGCATATTPRPVTGPWRVAIVTAGGLAGNGAGSFAIASDGAITVTTPAGRTCSYRATDEELEHVRQLLEASRPDSWAPAYLPAERCCDRFEWAMTAETEHGTFSTRWIDAPPPMPEPLLALAGAIAWNGDTTNIRHAYGARCR